MVELSDREFYAAMAMQGIISRYAAMAMQGIVYAAESGRPTRLLRQLPMPMPWSRRSRL